MGKVADDVRLFALSSILTPTATSCHRPRKLRSREFTDRHATLRLAAARFGRYRNPSLPSQAAVSGPLS